MKAAKTFAERAAIITKFGVPVMPVKPRDKKTVLKDWPQRATTDAAQIAEWDKENPSYNSGAVGRKDGFLVFDADRFISLSEQIERETKHHLDSIDTLRVQSSEGKMHLYFKHDARSEALGNFSVDDKDGEVFSVRAHNAYVVGPGSLHPRTGLAYEVIAEPTFGDIPVTPDWLMDWLEKSKKLSTNQKAKIAADDGAKIPEGGRDEFLFAEACKLRDAKVSRKVALIALKAINTDRCVPPMADSDISIKIKSAYTRESRVKPVKDIPCDEAAPTNDHFISRAGNTIKSKRIHWLWENRVPLGKLTLFAGHPDNGKSLAVTSLAAICTTGRDFPTGCKNPIPPSEVLMMLGEDDLDDTAVPRLIAAGADMSKIHFLEGIARQSGAEEIRLDIDRAALEAEIQKHPDARLLIIDPISNYLGDVNMMSDQEVRTILTPIKTLASKYGIAIVTVMHLNKKSEQDAISRVGGAMAFIGVARSSWLFTRDQPSEDGTPSDRFSMSRIKNNLSAATSGGISFQVLVKPVPIDEGEPMYTPYVIWGNVIQKTADDALGARREPGRPTGTDYKLQKAIDFLQEVLTEGSRPSKEITEEARERHNILPQTLRRAREVARIHTSKVGKDWLWTLPDVPTEPETTGTEEGAKQREFEVR